jgi:translocation and assembly module TamA
MGPRVQEASILHSSLYGITVILSMAFVAAVAQAADPQHYRVEMASIGDAASDATLGASSELESLRDGAPVSPFGLIARARADRDRLKTVLESFGYYGSRVLVTIDGLPLEDPGLGDLLGGLSDGTLAHVAIRFDLGPLYHLGRVDVDGEVPPEAAAAFGLKSGDPAVAADVLAAGERLQARLQEQGYAFARVDAPVAYEDAREPVLDVRFHVEAGAQARIGSIHFAGFKRIHERLLRARVLLHVGQRYSTSVIERARKDLASLGALAAVSAQAGQTVDATGGVPITFTVRERPRHAVTFNTAYSSDLGGSFGSSWTDRDVFGGAEQLALAGSLTNLGGSATTALGYNTSLKYLVPDFLQRDQSLQLSVGAIRQKLVAYDQTAKTSGVTVTRKLSAVWDLAVGVSTANEHIVQEGATHDYTLIGLPLVATYDSTDLASPLDDPRHGMRDSVSVTPTRSIGRSNATFTISQIKLAGYVDLDALLAEAPGRSVLAVRALAGIAQGAGEFSLPPDQRFYGGGSGTIRGYRYQAVGPSFPDGNPVGGTAILAGSVEFRQRFGMNFGGAAFIDGGQVSASLKPLPSVLRVGVGVGVRYYTPIGPVRLDIALPTERYSRDDDRFEIYVGLGQAF